MPGDEKRGNKAPSSERFSDPIPQALPGGEQLPSGRALQDGQTCGPARRGI